MSWTRLTTRNRFYIRRAETILRHHTKNHVWFHRALCAACDQPWGTWGCDDTVWAIDYLNSLSDLLVDNKPAPLRPDCGRRAPQFREKINRAAARAAAALQRWLTVEPQSIAPACALSENDVNAAGRYWSRYCVVT